MDLKPRCAFCVNWMFSCDPILHHVLAVDIYGTVNTIHEHTSGYTVVSKTIAVYHSIVYTAGILHVQVTNILKSACVGGTSLQCLLLSNAKLMQACDQKYACTISVASRLKGRCRLNFQLMLVCDQFILQYHLFLQLTKLRFES